MDKENKVTFVSALGFEYALCHCVYSFNIINKQVFKIFSKSFSTNPSRAIVAGYRRTHSVV